MIGRHLNRLRLPFLSMIRDTASLNTKVVSSFLNRVIFIQEFGLSTELTRRIPMIRFPKRGIEASITNTTSTTSSTSIESSVVSVSCSLDNTAKKKHWNPPNRYGISEAEMERIMLGGAEP